MVTLIKLGKKTQVRFMPERRGEAELIDLADGASISQFSDASEAEAEAQRLLTKHPLDTFCLQNADGVLFQWLSDRPAIYRAERRLHWRVAFLIASVLALITWGLLALIGSQPFSTATLTAVACSALGYLAISSIFNSIEASVIWAVVAILLFLGIPAGRAIQAAREKNLRAAAEAAASKRQASPPPFTTR